MHREDLAVPLGLAETAPVCGAYGLHAHSSEKVVRLNEFAEILR